MDLGALEVEVAVSSTVLAAAVSAWFGGDFCLERIGRKRTLVWASMIFIFGSLVMAVAVGPVKDGYYVLVLGRLIVGTAIGLASEGGPLYISECAPPTVRGSLTTLFNVAVVGGQVFASIVCGIVSYLPSTYNWRLMLAFGAVPALLQMIGFASLPPSPAWLVLKGRTEDARKILYQIRGLPAPEGEEEQEAINQNDDIEFELKEIVDEHELAKKGHGVSLWKLWRAHPAVRRAMTLGCMLWAVSQLAGINTIMYYGASIIRATGVGEEEYHDGEAHKHRDSLDIWLTVPLMSMQLLGIFVCYSIIDKRGRRSTLLLSMTLVWIGLVLIALGFAADSPGFTVFGMCFYLFSFGLGLSTMPYTINSEIYPVEYRSKCVAQATAVFWLSNFLVSLTFLSLARGWGHAQTFFLYAVIVVVSEIYFYFQMPETTGLSLHEIQQLFESQGSTTAAAATNNGGDAAAGVELPSVQESGQGNEKEIV
mmetsp:Transcript_25253/g.69741  ORF Transcript_25253/g.69741 Transcript_25253/m.69741 type:complete len:480 (+) Transcript_25253:168-1607(+)